MLEEQKNGIWSEPIISSLELAQLLPRDESVGAKRP
jgi:hypothetical protein